MTAVDFIIVGAMKCGTTTLAAQLAAQPGVFLTDPKEPNYFSDDAVFAQGPEWYARLFEKAGAQDLRGEASTHYTKLPTYPDTIARMQAAGLQPRIIYMIRDPLVRAVSHYIHEWSEARLSADPDQAFAQESTLTDYGRYAYQIAPFIDAFGKDAVHLTSLEELKADPQGTLDRLGTFLGRPLVWHEDLGAQNVSSERVRRLPLHGLLVDNPVARMLRRALVPKALRTRIRQTRSMTKRPELTAQITATLTQTYTEDRAALAKLFPAHPALQLCYPFADK